MTEVELTEAGTLFYHSQATNETIGDVVDL